MRRRMRRRRNITANVTPELRAHLTAVNEGDFKQRMLAGFEARKEKEESAVVEEKAAASAKEQADAMLEELNFIAQKKYGDDWWQQRPVVLDKFLENNIRNFNPADEKKFVLQILEQNVVHFLSCLKTLNLRRNRIETRPFAPFSHWTAWSSRSSTHPSSSPRPTRPFAKGKTSSWAEPFQNPTPLTFGIRKRV